MPIAREDEKRGLTLSQLRQRTLKRGQIKDFDAVLATLKDSFACDFTDEQAAYEANISIKTLRRWRRECPAFDDTLKRSSEHLPRIAKRQIRQFVEKDGDKQFIQWYSEHGKPKKEYSTRIETTGPEGSAVEVSLTKFQKNELEDKTDEELQRLIAEQVRSQAEKRGRS